MNLVESTWIGEWINRGQPQLVNKAEGINLDWWLGIKESIQMNQSELVSESKQRNQFQVVSAPKGLNMHWWVDMKEPTRLGDWT